MQNFITHLTGAPIACIRQFNSKMTALMVFATAMLLSITVSAQLYTSNFAVPIPGTNYGAAIPTGTLCNVPGVADPSNIADADLTNYARVSGLLNLSLLCETSSSYSIRAKLNLPNGVTSAPAGYQAGFRVAMAQLASVNVGSNISIRTYLGGNLQQTISGTNLVGISLLTGLAPVDIYATATAPFDEVELLVNNALLPIGVGTDFRFYYAFGTVSVLPVKFTEMSAKIQGGRLNVNWSTASETDNDRFIVQASSDGKKWTDIGTVASKANGGNSSVKLTYTFSQEWGNTVLAGFGLLGLLLLPATRNKLLRLGMILLVVTMVVSCAKENDGFRDLDEGGTSGSPVYVRVAQVDKDGTTAYSDVVAARK